MYPFKGSGKLWQDITQRDKYWWNSYNKVKHNAEFEKANLDNVLQSLGALLILISYKSSISKLSYYRYVSVDPQFAQAVAEGQSSGGNVTYLITKLLIDPYFITY